MILEANKKYVTAAITATLISGASLWEGTRYYAYYDIAGVPTVCQGYTGKGIVFGKKYSPEECRQFLHTELKEHSMGVLNCVTQPLSQNQHDAFTLFAYNVGVSGFCNSRAAKLFNSGVGDQSCYALYKGPDGSPIWSFAKIDGKLVYVQGLQNRRRYEAKMCLGNPDAKLD